MMDTAIQQQTDSNGQILVTPNERQALVQKLHSRWPLELSTRIENQAYEKSHGIKNNYIKFVQMYYQQVQTALQNRANQQQQQQQQPMNNNTITFSNLPQQQAPVQIANQVQHPLNQTPRFSAVQQQPSLRMNNPQGNIPNPMARLRSPASTTTIDLSQQMTNINPNDYSSFQPRYPSQPSMNLPRPRVSIPTNNFQQTTSNDIVHQFVVGNSSSTIPTQPTVNTNNSSTGDQLLQRILLSSIDGGSNKMPIQQNRSTVIPQPTRTTSTMNSNNTNSLRLSQQSSPSPSVVVIPTPTQTSTVQIQPSNNITIQQSPLSNNSNGPYSVNSQPMSTNSSTPILMNHSSPINRALPLPNIGSILSPDDEIINLIKYLKENVNRLQLLTQKFTIEGNTEKLRQVQSIHQQIIQFISNPTYETLSNAKHFREMLDRIPNRAPQQQQQQQPLPQTTPTTNVFNQCIKATNDFLLRDQKERINVTKRYLEPLTDVINGVPHKIMRLDIDNYPIVKIRSLNQSSLLSKLNEEINQLPNDIYSIEYISMSRTKKSLDYDDEYSNKNNGLILRCKLLEKSNPIVPSLRLYITTSYPEQSPEILSLTKTMPPRLEFTDGHPFFDQISSIFVSHLFKLRPQHTVTEILNIWRQSVQTAL